MRIRRLHTVLILAAALGGTTAVAHAQAIAPAAAAPSAGASVSTAAAGAPSVETVTLDQVVTAARATASGLRLAQATVDAARAALLQVQATNGVSLSGKGGYTHVGSLLDSANGSTSAAAAASAGASGQGVTGDNAQLGLSLGGPATSVDVTAQHSITAGASGDQVSSLNLSASQTVFDGYPGGRSAAAVKQAVYTWQAAQVAYDAAQKSVLYQVKQAYYTLLTDQATVLIRRASVEQSQQNLAYYKGLLTAGRATELDVLENQVTLTQAELDERSAENTAAVDRQGLSLLVGWPLERAYQVEDNPLPPLPDLDEGTALKTAYQDRQELRTLALNLASAQVNVDLQRSQAAPVISVTGSVGMGQDWSAGVNAGSFTLGGSIALPVLDGGLHDAQVQQAAAVAASYRIQQDQQTQSITIAVRTALFGVRDARDRLDLAGQNVQAAQGQYNLQKARYAAGQVTTLDVLTAFSALTTAQVGLQQARSTYALAILNLDNVTGR